MPLKLETIDAIFARMLARYGSTWVSKWAGVPMDAVKADWAELLDGLPRESIIYALGYLPLEFPPTSAQFLTICRRAPERAVPALPAPPRDPAKTAELAKASKKALELGRDNGGKAWAHRLKAKDDEGQKMPATHRAMYKAALATEIS